MLIEERGGRSVEVMSAVEADDVCAEASEEVTLACEQTG